MRYATGLFELAEEEDSVIQYENDLKFVKEVLGDPDVLIFFGHYNVDKKVKLDLLDEAFQDAVSKYVLNFLKLLVDKGRMNLCMDIIDAYHTLTNEYLGIKEGILYTSYTLSDEEIQSVEQAVSKNLDATVQLKVVLDESLIGGIKVVVENHVFDGSIKK